MSSSILKIKFAFCRVLDFKEYARKKKKEHEDKMTKEVDMLYERFLNNCHFELNLR